MSSAQQSGVVQRFLARAALLLLVFGSLTLAVVQPAHADGNGLPCVSIHGDGNPDWNNPLGWACHQIPDKDHPPMFEPYDPNTAPDNDPQKVVFHGEQAGAPGLQMTVGTIYVEGGTLDIAGGSVKNGDVVIGTDPNDTSDSTPGGVLRVTGTVTLQDSKIEMYGGSRPLSRATSFEVDGTLSVQDVTSVCGQYVGGGMVVNGTLREDDPNGQDSSLCMSLENDGKVVASKNTLTLTGAGGGSGSWLASSTLAFAATRTFGDAGISGGGTVLVSAPQTFPAAEKITVHRLAVQSTVTLAGKRSIDDLQMLYNGDLEGADVTARSLLDLQGGGTGQQGSPSALHVAKTGATVVTGRFLVRDGSIDLGGTTSYGPSGQGQLLLGGATVTNPPGGTIFITSPTYADEPFSQNAGGAVLVNKGTIVSTYVGAATLAVPVTNRGTIESRAGTVALGPSASGDGKDVGKLVLTQADGAQKPVIALLGDRTIGDVAVTGGGTLSIQGGTTTIQQTFDQPLLDVTVKDATLRLEHKDATVVVPGKTVGAHIDLAHLTVDQGTISGSTPIRVTGGLTTSSSSTLSGVILTTTSTSVNALHGGLYLSAATLKTGGTTITGGTHPVPDGMYTDFISVGSTSHWTNVGRLQVVAQRILLSGGGGTVENDGQMTVDPGAGATVLIEPPFLQHSGDVLINSGTLLLQRPTSDGGAIQIRTKAATLADDYSTLSPTGITISGPGTVTAPLGGGGTVVGPVVVAGGWTMDATSTAEAGIQTTTGPIAVPGGATLAGTLKIDLPSTFSPGAGQTFTLLSVGSGSGTLTGTFDHVIGLENVTQPYTINYTPTAVTLQF